jgi:hypothetical protein
MDLRILLLIGMLQRFSDECVPANSHRVRSPRVSKGCVQVEEQPLLTRGLLTRVALT